jgi:hypothetical protein
MRNIGNHFVLPLLPPEGHSSVNAFIAYEDLEAGKRAKEMCDFVAQNLGHEWTLDSELWSFRALGVPQLRDIAADNAVKGDIIIVSCHGGHLPAEVTEWIESWPAQPARAVAMVALFGSADGPLNPSSEARATLALAAERHGMKFFAGPAQFSQADECPPPRRWSWADEPDGPTTFAQ